MPLEEYLEDQRVSQLYALGIVQDRLSKGPLALVHLDIWHAVLPTSREAHI